MPVTEEVLVTAQSQKQARRAMDEIAMQGGWKAGGHSDWGVLYQKHGEELAIVKKAERQWQVVKRKP